MDFDERTRILHITGEGFWTMATLAAFSTAVFARSFALRMRYGQFAVVNDVRNMPVQAVQVAKGLEFMMAKRMQISKSPMATVTASQLVKMQAERVLKAAHSQVFTDWDEAMAWLETVWVQQRQAA